MNNILTCPKCGAEIQLTEALTGQIEQSIRAKYEAETAKKDQEIDNERQVLKRQREDLEKQRQSVDEKVAEQVKAERKKIAEQEKAKIIAEQSEQMKGLEQELEEKRKQVIEANKKELELRKQQQKLEEEKAAIELTVQRQVDAERKKIFEEAGQKAAEEQQFKMREKDDLIKSMQVQIENLKRRAEVGSQEAQGEAMEGALHDILQQTFPFDRIEEVKKGQRGGDVVQVVRNTAGKECGKILWESKNTKDFQKPWIEKLKTDQQQAGADIAVIMSVALPKGIANFGQYEDVWVTDYGSAIGLATALRQMLIAVTRQKMVTAGQETMKDVIYNYITGQEFGMRVKRIADTYVQMQRDLEQEKRAMNMMWKKREKQISTKGVFT